MTGLHAWTLLMVNRPAPHHQLNMMCMYIPVCQLWHPLHSWPSLEEEIPYYAFLLKISSLLFSREFSLALVGAWVKGGVVNIWPDKPFETVMVIKGYTNKIELNWMTAGRKDKTTLRICLDFLSIPSFSFTYIYLRNNCHISLTHSPKTFHVYFPLTRGSFHFLHRD